MYNHHLFLKNLSFNNFCNRVAHYDINKLCNINFLLLNMTFTREIIKSSIFVFSKANVKKIYALC